MNETSWEKIKYLPISSFVLVTIIFLIVLYSFLKLHLNLTQLKKFKAQDVIYYKNKKLFYLLYSFISVFFLMYLINIIFFVIYIPMINNAFNSHQMVIYYFLESFVLVFLIFSIYLLIWINKYVNGFLIIIKNKKIILLNETILLEDIIKIFHDQKRKYFYVNWKDSQTKGNIAEVKIKYHYELKDLLLSLDLPTFFD